VKAAQTKRRGEPFFSPIIRGGEKRERGEKGSEAPSSPFSKRREARKGGGKGKGRVPAYKNRKKGERERETPLPFKKKQDGGEEEGFDHPPSAQEAGR